jgi:class 3 adenylate cyclase/cold shock CspA family protein
MTLSDALESPGSRVERVVLVAQVADAASLKTREAEATWLSTYAWFLDTLAENVDDTSAFVRSAGDGAMYVFDRERAVDAVNAAILFQETLTAGGVARKVACHAGVGMAFGEVVSFTNEGGCRDYAGVPVDRAVALAGIATAKGVLVDGATLSVAPLGRVRSRAGETRQPPRPPEEYAGPAQRATLAGVAVPVEFQEIYWDQPGGTPRFRLAHTPSTFSAAGTSGVEDPAAAALEERLNGTVRRWDKKKGQGFIISKEGEFFYVDRRYTAGPPELNPGAKVYFVPRAPLIEGKNRVASCVLALGQSLQGKVVRVGKKGFGFVEVGDSCGNTQRLFMFLGENRDGIGGGDSVGFTVGENDRGPVAQNASRAQATWRPRHEPDPFQPPTRERERER